MRLARATAAELDALFGEDTRSVWVCSPWITADGLSLLRSAMSRCNTSLLWSFELWTRIDETEREAGITDFGAIDSFLDDLESDAPDLRISIFSAPLLHAKAIWTDSSGLVGSANLTGRAFGDNIEMTVRLDRTESVALGALRDELRPQLTKVEREAWRRFLKGVPLPPKAPEPPPKSSSAWEDFHERLLQKRDSGGIR